LLTNQATKEISMDRMLVVVFDNENKAYDGLKALQQLDDDRSLNLYAYAVIKKNADGSVAMKQNDDVGPLGTLLGTSVGSLVGLLAGPAGAVLGATAGMTGGSIFDLHNARIADDYLDDVQKALAVNKVAVVAQVDEDWTTPVDSRMEELGGDVFRRGLSDVTATANHEELTAMKADLAQYKAELAKSRADRQAKIQTKVAQLDAKILARQKTIGEQARAAQRLAELKAQRLQDKVGAKTSL
jgi:uncharacterized membrane protein